jgi:uncharacterized integral membrane protein
MLRTPAPVPPEGIGESVRGERTREDPVRAFLVVMVILLVLLLIFAVQNPGSTEVEFITFSSTAPLLLIILVSAAVGLLLGVAIMLPGSIRRSSRLRRLDSEIRVLEKKQAADTVPQAQPTEKAVEKEIVPPAPAAVEEKTNDAGPAGEA